MDIKLTLNFFEQPNWRKKRTTIGTRFMKEHDNQIGDLGAPQSLADALQHSSKLNQLTLRFNEIGDPGARSIAALLQKKRNTNSSGPTIE
ncbi:unnamed protein product [Adineta ricciae]|uniref:Uncharacterized protein n=1 Tax=Adineta ricciae TaxID=249248 RepID=A0A816EAN0_ADIRI|nr:unnamed protein product [Adineta ricciae]